MRERCGMAAAALVALLLGPGQGEAADLRALPDSVDLPTVLRLVRDASPRLAADRENIAAAEADRITAGAYPNPSVSYNLSHPGGAATMFTGTRQEQVSAEQPLLFPGQYSARISKANRDVEAARARVAAGASTLAAEAGAAYVALLVAQDKSELVTGANDELMRFHQIVAGRQASGLASQYDLARIDVELAGFSSRQAEARAAIADASAALASLVGLKDWKPHASGKLSPSLLPGSLPFRPALDLALESPSVRAAARDQASAEAGVTVARRERWPNVSITVGRGWTTNPFGSADFIGLTVEVPIFDTRRGPLAKAESAAREATLRHDLAVAETASNLEGLTSVIATREAALRRFEDDAASRLPNLKQMAEDNYRLRGGSVLELLDATRSRIDLESTHIDLLSSLFDSQLRYLGITGNLDRALAGTPGAGTSP